TPHPLPPAPAEGRHTFDVRATDPAANTDGTPASHSWTVDLTAPQTSITAQPNDPSSNTAPSFSFNSSESGSTFECRIDGGSWTSWGKRRAVSPALAEGSHTFDVRATDPAANTDGTHASHSWTVDPTAQGARSTPQPDD